MSTLKPGSLISTLYGPFPYAFSRHIRRVYWDGVQPNHRTALVVDGRAVSYDKETHALLKQHGFKHCGRKWARIDGYAQSAGSSKL